MKITIDIADSILLQAKRLAERRGTTVKGLVELGLRRAIDEEANDAGFEFVPVTDKLPVNPSLGPGLSWAQTRDVSYEGRGGIPLVGG
jgi:hypothetical protein